MHDTASDIGGRFLRRHSRAGHLIVELGAADINGSIRSFAHPEACYVGIDTAPGPGVDLVANGERPLPIKPQSVDIVVATSVFEHDGFFWNTFTDLLRLMKAGGLIYINAPSNGDYHRYPNDNWRFYPDAGKMLEKWGRRNGHDVRLLESFIADRQADIWNDFVAIFQLGPIASEYSHLSDEVTCANVWRMNDGEPSRIRLQTQDTALLADARREIGELQARHDKLAHELERAKVYAGAYADVVDPHYRPGFVHAMGLEVGASKVASPPVASEAPPVVSEAPPVVSEAPQIVSDAPDVAASTSPDP